MSLQIVHSTLEDSFIQTITPPIKSWSCVIGSVIAREQRHDGIGRVLQQSIQFVWIIERPPLGLQAQVRASACGLHQHPQFLLAGIVVVIGFLGEHELDGIEVGGHAASPRITLNSGRWSPEYWRTAVMASANISASARQRLSVSASCIGSSSLRKAARLMRCRRFSPMTF